LCQLMRRMFGNSTMKWTNYRVWDGRLVLEPRALVPPEEGPTECVQVPTVVQ
jgi:hypothetical protein